MKLSEAVHSITSSICEEKLLPIKMSQNTSFTLGQSDIDVVVNFVVRFVLHAEVVDASAQMLGVKGKNLSQTCFHLLVLISLSTFFNVHLTAISFKTTLERSTSLLISLEMSR